LAWEILNVFAMYRMGFWWVLYPFPCDVLAVYLLGTLALAPSVTRTLAPSTVGTRTGRLAQALGMISNAMYSLDELEADITIGSSSVQMVANLVDEVEEEESSEGEESAFEGDRHH